MLVISAKGSGKTLSIGPRFTEAVPVKNFGKMSPIGVRFTEAVEAVSGNGILLTSPPWPGHDSSQRIRQNVVDRPKVY